MGELGQDKMQCGLICLLLGAGICLPQVMRAQVTIGANVEPKSFSLLELAGDTRGLRMPQLTTVQRDGVDFGTYAASDAKGLMIFNTDTKCMEYWNGTNWVNSCGDASQPAVPGDVVAFSPTYNTFAANTNLFTGAVLVGGSGDDRTRGTNILYTDIDAGVFNYTGGEGQSLPRLEYSHPSGLSVIIPAQTLNGSKGSAASGQITIRISGMPSAVYAGKAFDLPITLLGRNLTVRVNTGCGAYTGIKTATDANGIATNWLQFQCYNLGASNTIDPFTPDQYLHGAKYRFGAKEPSLTMAEDQASADAVSDWSSKPVETGVDEEWTTANNPCPTGWRLPTRAEWIPVITTANNSQPVGTWTNDAANYSSGQKFGSSLFLPAAGHRYVINGTLYYRGNSCNYWSSTTYNSSGGYYMFFGSGSRNVGQADRLYGYSVRCVAE